MDSRRNSGAFARPNPQAYNYDQSQQSYGAPSNKQQSFSARTGQQHMVPDADEIDQGYFPPLDNAYTRPGKTATTHEPRRQAVEPMTESRGSIPYEQSYEDEYQSEPMPNQAPRSSRGARSSVQPTLEIPSSKQRRQDLYNQASPLSPTTQGGVAGGRKGSVPDRSPLQKLEDISKEEKRARMEEAEHRARQRSGRDNGRFGKVSNAEHDVMRNSSARNRREADAGRSNVDGARRHVSAPSQRPSQPAGRAYNAPGLMAVDGSAEQRFRQASEALRRHGTGNSSGNPVAREERRQGDQRFRAQTVESSFPEKSTTAQRSDTYAGNLGSQGQSTAAGQIAANRTREDKGGDIDRSDSKQNRHHARDAGLGGAATAAVVSEEARRNKNDHRGDRRRSQEYPLSGHDTIDRSDSKRLQKPNAPEDYPTGNRDPARIPESQRSLQSHRAGAKEGIEAAARHQDPDPLPASAVKNPRGQGPTYQVPPQTAAAQTARDQIGFGNVQQAPPISNPQQAGHHSRLDSMFHRQHDQHQQQPRGAPALEDWRQADTARLVADDLMFADGSKDTGADNAWWERNGTSQGPGSLDGTYEEEATSFRPPLYLKCGPLLRYRGMRRERSAARGRNGITEREIWRGSIMIVTLDSQSSYERVPTLRLFAQPMQLLPPPPKDFGNDLPTEYVDPLAGQIKLSRTGQALYVKPVEQLEEGVDLSQVEDDSGIFEGEKSSTLSHQQIDGPNGRQRINVTTQPRSRIHAKDGERSRKYREVKGVRLFAERGVTFWRFNLEIELASQQARIAYRINRGPAIGFWVPGRGQTMTMMFHSCNGFSLSVDPDLFSGPDPLWRDVLCVHQIKPYHVMIGGGDQIYNDAAMRDTELFRDWLQTKNPEHKHRAEFTPDMQEELEEFYLERYSMWFSQGLFSMANSQIPMVNIWDDHDIIDGYGSYPHHFMSTKVFAGLGAIAFKYYMLFQHQSVVAETYREEPSWLLGASPGPYINEYSRSVFVFLGRKVAFLGLDCRTERMRDEVLSQQSYDLIFNRCRTEIIKGETKHLIVLLGVPIAYPRLNFLENILTSRVMDPIKAIGRTGVLGGFVNKFDGGVEILDDLDDHWTAKHHKAERNWFIQELQELAAEKSVRVTILGGDVHLGAVGQFYTNKKFGIPKDRDHRYMPNIISSAIVNTPPPVMMGDILNKRNKVHHLDAETDEDMIPMFDRDVDGRPRNNHHLLPRRNYCSIREYHPGSTPPSTPPLEESVQTPWSQNQVQSRQEDRRYPPGAMQRSRSLTKDSFRPGNLIRRLSGSRSRNPPVSLRSDQIRSYEDAEQNQRRYSSGGGNGNSATQDDDSYFPQGVTAINRGPPSSNNSRPTSANNNSMNPTRPTNTFRRRPTVLSEKAAAKYAAKGGAEGNLDGLDHDHIDLEGGLDICLNMEVSQRDPAGITVPYRLLVPALFYEGQGDVNTARFKTRRASLMDRIRGKRQERRDSVSGEEDSGSEEGDSRSSSPVNGRGDMLNAPNRRAMEGTAATGVGAGAAGAAMANRHDNARAQGSQPDNRAPNQRPPRIDGTYDATPRNNNYYSSQPISRPQGGGQHAGKEYGPASVKQQPPRTQNQSHSGRPQSQSGRQDTAGTTRPQGGYSHPWSNRQSSNAAQAGDVNSQSTGRTPGNNVRLPNNGYGPPPVGANAPQSGPPARPYDEDYEEEPRPKKKGFFSSFRRTSSQRDEGYGRERYGEDSEMEDSMTESDLESLEPEPRPRRQSKTDRFFGVGDGGGGSMRRPGRDDPGDEYGGGQYEQEQKRKPGWKIWK